MRNVDLRSVDEGLAPKDNSSSTDKVLTPQEDELPPAEDILASKKENLPSVD